MKRIGRVPPLVIGFAAHMTVYIVLLLDGFGVLSVSSAPGGSLWVYMILAGLLGVGDGNIYCAYAAYTGCFNMALCCVFGSLLFLLRVV